jgi:primosomal protein N' (replication factor Y)
MIQAVSVLVDGSSGLEFDYSLPPAMHGRVQIGSRVRIPLRARKATGTVTNLKDVAPDSEEAGYLKEVSALIEEAPVLNECMIKLGRWMAEYYQAPMETVMRVLLPEAVRSDQHSFKEQKYLYPSHPAKQSDIDEIAKKAPRQAAILRELTEIGEPMPVSDFGSGGSAAIKGLVEKGWVKVQNKVVQRDPHAATEFLPDAALELTEEQAVAVERTVAAINSPTTSRPLLMHGVTGSGKTEVFLQSIQIAIDMGKSALVLVPEISLTPQTVERFKTRFSHMQEKVAVLHSHLSQGERFDEWHKIQSKSARIVIGARSAIFAPLDNLGLIVVDEEHENTYKQESPPRYHARDVAIVRSKFEPCAVLLGSATPSLESFQNTISGKYELIELTKRIDNRSLPIIRVVDMKREPGGQGGEGKTPSIISERLRKAVDDRMEKGEQIILFLNRRGFARSLLCPACGHVCECQHCSVPLTYHRNNERLICHICGYQQIAPRRCPKCADPAIRFSGFGTEKVEEVLRKVFPKVRLARVDADTMSRKGVMERTLRDFKSHKLDMLMGTQMIAKGLHFPSVTLVGIINADLGLYVPDFRAGERTFQLLTQVAGRAGRGEMEGEVVIQTFTPQSPSIQFARHHDFLGYADQELQFRKQFEYPPFSHVVLITTKCVHERRGEFSLETLHKRLAANLPEGIIMGEPTTAPLARAAGQFRFQLMLRARRTKEIVNHIQNVLQAMTFPSDVNLVIDVDPYQLS